MANKVWVQQSDGVSAYRCVIHFPCPAGNNSAGISWQNVLLNAGLSGTSVLSVGSNSWQMTSAEQTAIQAGTTIELVTTLSIDTAEANSANVTALANQAVADYQAKIGAQYKWWGYSQ